MPKFIPDKDGLNVSASGTYDFSNSDVWIPQISTLQSINNPQLGEIYHIVGSGALYIASGSGFYEFTLGAI